MNRRSGSTRTEIAVYGKGGIGKSTISANLSAALALAGKSVLQIGCDPKHDSTRLLLDGRTIPTVLDRMRDVPEEELSVSDILYTGWNGVGCIEAGGPKPGVGCAGRGIISAFEFLSKKKIKEQYDCILYDVLGDVVCGGFAVPIRREYADTVILVTSGEFMAVYAANNILRGIRNYDGTDRKRAAGIIFNERLLEKEEERVVRFAESVGLPILAKIPRSHAFAEAEEKNLPVAAIGGCEYEKKIFEELAGRIISGLPLYPAEPLPDDELERIVLGTHSSGRGREPSEHSVVKTEKADHGNAVPDDEKDPENSEENKNADAGKPAKAGDGYPDGRTERRPLYGCAFNGAATTAVCIRDAEVIVHSPRACAYYTWQNISSPGRKSLFNRGILLPSAVSPRLSCTEITRNEAVYGGLEKLKQAVSAAMEKRPGAVIVISSCVSGIIGDDVLSLEELSTPETPVIVIPADGDIAGDYMTGIRMTLTKTALRLIDRSRTASGRLVNLVGEVTVSDNLEANFQMLEELLAKMDIRVNCRFPANLRTDELRAFMEAPVNILASEGASGLELKEWLENEFGAVFLKNGMPTGFAETRRFVQEIAAFFSCEEKLPEILSEVEEQYRAEIGRLRPVLAGKRLLLTTISTDMDWLLSAAADAGMDTVWVGVADYLNQGIRVSSDPGIQKVTESFFDIRLAEERIEKLRPDLVVSNYISAVLPGDYVLDNMPMTQRQGFFSGVHVLKRWAAALKNQKEGEWIHDRELFQKYFS